LLKVTGATVVALNPGGELAAVGLRLESLGLEELKVDVIVDEERALFIAMLSDGGPQAVASRMKPKPSINMHRRRMAFNLLKNRAVHCLSPAGASKETL
jgi:hypothetical protein